MDKLASFAAPCVVAGIILHGWFSGIDIFDAFLAGAKGGIKTAFGIIPALVALITAVGVFSASGALDLITHSIAPIAEKVGIPAEVIPLALIRPISGSGSLAVLNDILQKFGADSFIGRVAAVMQGSTETTFYTMAVYFGAISVKNTRYTLPAALFADFIGFLMSVLFVRLLF
ncbi:MAG: spore maturation protein [Oscillospiraceae bacterium]|nr:spore maturation protein [Oscillospiraceae bacterium]